MILVVLVVGVITKTSEVAMALEGEIVHRAFADKSTPLVSYGASFIEACRGHIQGMFNASRVYIICSGSLARSTNHVKDLQQALGQKVVGTRVGMKPHTLWSEVLEIAHEVKEAKADLLVTLGGGSLSDGAKLVAFVSILSTPPAAQSGW